MSDIYEFTAIGDVYGEWENAINLYKTPVTWKFSLVNRTVTETVREFQRVKKKTLIREYQKLWKKRGRIARFFGMRDVYRTVREHDYEYEMLKCLVVTVIDNDKSVHDYNREIVYVSKILERRDIKNESEST